MSSSLFSSDTKTEFKGPEIKQVSLVPVPAYSDIAKAANDLLNKDFYHTAAANLEVKSKAPNGVNFTVKGKSAHEGALTGSLEAKKTDKANGITGTVAWSTLNAIDGKIELDGTLAKDLKVETTGTFKPDTQDTASKLNIYFKQPAFHLRAFVDALKGPVVTADAVVGHEGFVAGAEASYNVPQAALSKYSASVGYLAPQYSTALTATNNLQVFSASFFQKVSGAVQAGAKATYDTKSSGAVGLELAGKYQLDPLAFVKGKVNDKGIAAVSYNNKVRDGFTLGIGASFDTQKLNEATHKVGAHFAFES